jgi:dTDP-4-amino-4,6-dideoxygalactose transaminase
MPELAINGGTPIRSEPYPGWPAGDDRVVAAVAEVVRGGRWGGYPEPGPKATEFEERFAAYQGAKHGVLMANGSVTMEIRADDRRCVAGVRRRHPGDLDDRP